MILSCGFCSEYEVCQARKEAAAVIVCADDDGIADREVCVVVEKAPGAEAPIA